MSGTNKSSMMFCSCAPITNLSVFIEQLIVTKVVVIVIFARTRPQLSSQARLIQFTLSYPVSLKSTLILFSRTAICHSSSFLASRLQFLCIFLLYFRCAISYKRVCLLVHSGDIKIIESGLEQVIILFFLNTFVNYCYEYQIQ